MLNVRTSLTKYTVQHNIRINILLVKNPSCYYAWFNHKFFRILLVGSYPMDMYGLVNALNSAAFLE